MKKYIIGISALVVLILIRLLWVVFDKEDVVPLPEVTEEVEVVTPQPLSISIIGCVNNATIVEFKDGDKLVDVLDYTILKSSYSNVELESLLYKPLKDKMIFEVKCKTSVYFTGCLLEEKQVYFETGEVVSDVINQVSLLPHYSVVKYDAIKYDVLKAGKNVNIECKKSTTVSGAVLKNTIVYFEDGEKVKDVTDQFELSDEVDVVLYNNMKSTALVAGKNVVIPAMRIFYISGLSSQPLEFKYTEGDDTSMFLDKVKALNLCNRIDEVPFRKATAITDGATYNVRCFVQVSFYGEVAEERTMNMTKGDTLESIRLTYEMLVEKKTSDTSAIDWSQVITEDIRIEVLRKA